MAGQASVIDELVVQLSLDTTKFTTEQKQAVNTLRSFQRQAQEAATDTDRSAQKMVDGFSRVTKEILALGLTLAGANGLKDLVVGTVQSADAIGKRTRALDMDAAAMSRWVNMARRAGVEEGQAAASFNSMVEKLGAVRARLAPMTSIGLPALQAIGVSQPDTRSPEHFINQVVSRLRAVGELEPGKRAALAATVPFGPEMLAMAQQFKTQKEFDAALERSTTITGEQAKAARDLTTAFTGLTIAVEEQKNKMLPALEKMVIPAITTLEHAVRGDVTPEQMDKVSNGTPEQQRAKEDRFDNFMRAIMDPAKVRKYLIRPTESDPKYQYPPDEGGPKAAPHLQPGAEVLYDPFFGPPLPRERPRTRPSEGTKVMDQFGYPALRGGGGGAAGNVTNNNQRPITIQNQTIMVPQGEKSPESFADRFNAAVESTSKATPLNGVGGPR